MTEEVHEAMQTIDFKAELRDLSAARLQAKAMGAQLVIEVRQVDTYYRLADGRLKKREADNEPAEWIFYHRPDRIRPRMSNYSVLTDAQAMTRWGTHGLRSWLTVTKTRETWMTPHVHIHFDRVDDLGTFIEFEARVSREFDVKECHLAIAQLRESFGPITGEPVSVSYCDLMQAHLEAKAAG